MFEKTLHVSSSMYKCSIDAGPSGTKQRILQRAVGRERFLAPDMKTRQMLLFSTIVYAILALLVLLGVALCFILTRILVASIFTVIAIVTLATSYYLGGKFLSKLLLDTAVRRATEAFDEFRPHVIVAASFGAVVAFHMDVPKMPLLLFTPAQRLYKRFIQKEDQISLRHYPYTLIVHGSRDKTISLEDSIRLVETSEVGRCRLEVVDDDHHLRSLTQEETRFFCCWRGFICCSVWVEEVYKRGRANVRALAEGGDKFVDLSYFDEFGRQLSSSAEEEEYEEQEEDEEDYDVGRKDSVGSLGSPRTTATTDDKSEGAHRGRLVTADSLHSQDTEDNNTTYAHTRVPDTTSLLR